jgi:hypothetical protein
MHCKVDIDPDLQGKLSEILPARMDAVASEGGIATHPETSSSASSRKRGRHRLLFGYQRYLALILGPLHSRIYL